jgi:RNA polymerase sigma-70 factor (ECF subfamily)
MHTTPITLLQRLKQPDSGAAWERFIELYTPFLLYWARRLGAGPQDAEDLTQEVLGKLVEKLPEFFYDRGKSFRGWLRTITINLWRDRLRRCRPHAGVNDHELEDRAGPDELEALWEDEHRRHLVARALQVMRTDFRESTWKACWEHVALGRPAAAVAAELCMTENAVFIACTRVLARLRQELDGLLD